MLPDSAAIEPLLAERDALRGWLARLDEAGTATPEAVRAKVRADYERRLDGVIDRLRAHADTITARLTEDRAEYDEQMGLLQAAEIALAEAQLRHAVGEYDGAQFEREQARHGDEIVRCRLGRDAALERIERMETVHALVTQPIVPVESLAPTPVATPEPAPVAAAPAPLPDERLDDAMLSVFDEPKEAPAPGHSPLSFRPGTGMAQDQTRYAPQPRRSFPNTTEVPPLGRPEEALPRFSRPPEPAPVPAPTPVMAAPTPAPVIVEAPVAQAAAPAATNDELFGGDTIVAAGPAADVTAPAPRTLRCSECGAMNKPLEWYCEKCGAELTAN